MAIGSSWLKCAKIVAVVLWALNIGIEMRSLLLWTSMGLMSPLCVMLHQNPPRFIICLDTQVSTANPWLDFLSASEASDMASDLNADLEEYCSTGPPLADSPTLRRLYGMGLLPIVPSVSVSAILEEIEHIAKLPHLRGVILGTQGLGKGLDDGKPH